jgi:hypothetical protein
LIEQSAISRHWIVKIDIAAFGGQRALSFNAPFYAVRIFLVLSSNVTVLAILLQIVARLFAQPERL